MTTKSKEIAHEKSNHSKGLIVSDPARSTYLGSSDIAAVMGVSPWKTRLDVYLEKIGEGAPPDADKAKIFKRGKRMEPLVIDMLADEYGWQVVARNARYTDQEYDWMKCEVDAETDIDGERINLEIKTVHPFAAGKFGDMGTDQIPVEYAAQAMYSLMITGRRVCKFGVLVGSDNLSTYEIVRDEVTIAGMRAAAVAFWNDHVLARVAPDPVNLPDIYKLMHRDKGGSQIEANDQAAYMVEEYTRLSALSKDAEDKADELKFQIGSYMLGVERMQKKDAPGGHALIRNGAEILTITLQEQTRLDTKAVKSLYPKIAEECSKSSSFFVFRTQKRK